MATRAVIARHVARRNGTSGFKGRYHHWDGYPSGLGQSLYHLPAEAFDNDVKKMLKVLIDDHPAGWSTINGTDWSQEPGFLNYDKKTCNGSDRPQCYCHGDRKESPAPLLTEKSNTDTEFAYVFEGRVMHIWNRCWKENRWMKLASVSLDNPEPDWDKLDQQAYGEDE